MSHRACLQTRCKVGEERCWCSSQAHMCIHTNKCAHAHRLSTSLPKPEIWKYRISDPGFLLPYTFTQDMEMRPSKNHQPVRDLHTGLALLRFILPQEKTAGVIMTTQILKTPVRCSSLLLGQEKTQNQCVWTKTYVNTWGCCAYAFKASKWTRNFWESACRVIWESLPSGVVSLESAPGNFDPQHSSWSTVQAETEHRTFWL